MRSRVTILNTKTINWLADVNRENWTDLIINFTHFYQADRIIIPWRPQESHMAVYHFDSSRKVIEWFDSSQGEPNHFCTMAVSNLIKVSFLFRFCFLFLGKTSKIWRRKQLEERFQSITIQISTAKWHIYMCCSCYHGDQKSYFESFG